MKQKIRLGLIFGGQSGEHEVSLQSAHSIYQALDKEKYDITLIGIDKSGQWRLGRDGQFFLNASRPDRISLNVDGAPVITTRTRNQQAEIIDSTSGGRSQPIDVAFPIIHGTGGEDGALQGFLETLGVAYVGAGVLGSAVGMDKDVMKRLLREASLPVPRFVSCLKTQQDAIDYTEMKKLLGSTLFVKPANSGSSVGIHKVTTAPEFASAIADAFLYDNKILIEEAIIGRELECAVLGNDQPVASAIGEVLPKDEFYTYKAKYFDGFLDVEIPAKLPDALSDSIQKMAVLAFQTLGCSGMARVDFFVRGDEIFVNELNTLPGFTNMSMYPKLWQASGLSYSDLLNRLIDLAIERKAGTDRLKRDYRPELNAGSPASTE